jgi:hypothetical protein
VNRTPVPPQQLNNNNSILANGDMKDVGKWRKELERLCGARHLGDPVFKTAQMGSNKKFVSTVIVGGNDGKRFQTFPSEFPAAAMAEDAASKLAVEALSSVSTVARMKSSDSSASAESAASSNGHGMTNGGMVDDGDLSKMLDRDGIHQFLRIIINSDS